jgi:hypothetical protein
VATKTTDPLIAKLFGYTRMLIQEATAFFDLVIKTNENLIAKTASSSPQPTTFLHELIYQKLQVSAVVHLLPAFAETMALFLDENSQTKSLVADLLPLSLKTLISFDQLIRLNQVK